MSVHGLELNVEPDWQDVLARSSAISRRHKRHLLLAAALVAALAAIAGPALAASGWLDSIWPGTPVSSKALSATEVQALQQIATRGAPVPLSQVDLPAGRLAALQSAGLTGIRLIGQTQGFAFYAFDLKKNRQCYDAVRQTTARIVGGIMRCSSNPTGPTFPSPERPVVDLSLVGADAGQPMHTIQLAGIAADGIAAVAVLGSDGNVYGKTQVVGNVYVSTGLPPQADGPVITYDASGATIWCFPYVAPKFPASVLRDAGCQPFPTNATGRWVNPNRTSTTSTR